MAKLGVRCSCGTSFQVDQAPQDPNDPVKCPSCGKGLRVSIRRPEAAAPKDDVRITSVEPASVSGSNKRTLLIGGGVGLVVVLGIVIVVLMMSGGKEEPEENKPKYVKYPLPAVAIPDRAVSAPAPAVQPAAAPAPPKTAAPPSKLPALPPPTSFVPVPAPDAAAPAAPVRVDVPSDVVEKVRARVLSLPPYYLELCLTNPERAKAMRLVRSKVASPEDVTFLRELPDREKVKHVHEEQENLRGRYAELERGKLKGLPVDKIVLKSGSEVHGIILGVDGQGTVKMERLLSRGRGIMPYRRTQIKSIEKGKGLGGDFQSRWRESLTGTTADREQLMEWCLRNNLVEQSRLVAHLILMSEPGHTKARAEAGLREDPFWLHTQVAEQGGMIEYEGREWLPRELKVDLIRRGYLLSHGKWYKSHERKFRLPSLLNPDSSERSPEIAISTYNTRINSDFSRSFRRTNIPGTPALREVPEDKAVEKFYSPILQVLTYRDPERSVFTQAAEQWAEVDKPVPAPGTMIQGHVTLRVDVGEPIHGGKLRMLAEVKGGNRMVVWVGEGEERKKFYQIAKRDLEERELPDSVKGKTHLTFDVRFDQVSAYNQRKEDRIYQTAVRDTKTKSIIYPKITVKHERLIPEFGTKLFPSDRNTREVFRLTVTLGRPQPDLDALFAKVPRSLLR